MIAPIQTVTKEIFRPHKNLILKIKVVIGSADQNGQRKKFISNYEYESQKYTNCNKLNSVKITTSDYLILETFVDMNNRSPNWRPSSIIFSYDNLYQFKSALNDAYQWFLDGSDVFNESPTGNVTLNPKPNIVLPTCHSYHGKGYADSILRFAPTVQLKEDGTYGKAILVMMGTNLKQVCSMSFEELCALLDYLSYFNLTDICTGLVSQTLIALPMLTTQKGGINQ